MIAVLIPTTVLAVASIPLVRPILVGDTGRALENRDNRHPGEQYIKVCPYPGYPWANSEQ